MEEEDALLQRQRSGEHAGTSAPSIASPFAAGAQSEQQRPVGRGSSVHRSRANKSGELGPKRQSSGQLRPVAKSGQGRGTAAEKPGHPGPGVKPPARSSADTARQPPGRLASQKSTPHLQKVGAAAVAKSARPAGGMKRAVSLTELQPDTQPGKAMGRANSADLGPPPQRSASRRLLQKLTFSTPASTDKAAGRLPQLAPVERKILAAVGQRDWIKVDSKAEASLLRRDRHAVTHELGIQIRDLRLLDPLMASSYPSCLLVRDRALLVNLEYIKCIVTTGYVLILGAEQGAAKAFVAQLQARLRTEAAGAADEPPPAASVLGLSRPSVGGPPFELRALEAALDEVTRHLERLCSELEAGVRPMLGTTTAGKVTSDYLERMRRMKTRNVRLRTRVETLKEVLEKYLDDEDDLKSVHLSAKLREQQAAAYRRLVRRSLRGAAGQPGQPQPPGAVGAAGPQLAQQHEALAAPAEPSREASEVEMLLEAYYMHLDSTWNRLVDLGESFDDVEEMMDLEMDSYRNNVLRMKVFLGACHLTASTWWAIANIFGMNLGLLYDDLMGDTYRRFIQVCVISTGLGLLFMLLFTLFLQRYRLALTSIKS